LAWHHVTGDRWQVSVVVLYVMLVECALWGLALVGIGRLEGMIAGANFWPVAPTGVPADMPWTVAGRGAVVAKALGFVGAGVYEEMLFRLLLLPPVLLLVARLAARPAVGVGSAVLLTSLLFAAAHYVGPHGEPFEAFSFAFRLSAGAFFALVFVYRGFGVAAGAHALYDIFVGIG
jgi:hypothetical protein